MKHVTSTIEAYRDGIRAAAAFAGYWDQHITGTMYRFEDIILCKFNLRKRPRKKHVPKTPALKKHHSDEQTAGYIAVIKRMNKR